MNLSEEQRVETFVVICLGVAVVGKCVLWWVAGPVAWLVYLVSWIALVLSVIGLGVLVLTWLAKDDGDKIISDR